MKMTADHYEIMQEGVNATCINGVWHWTRKGVPCGRIVNSLLKRGLMSATYYTGGRASAWITDEGRKLLKETV